MKLFQKSFLKPMTDAVKDNEHPNIYLNIRYYFYNCKN